MGLYASGKLFLVNLITMADLPTLPAPSTTRRCLCSSSAIPKVECRTNKVYTRRLSPINNTNEFVPVKIGFVGITAPVYTVLHPTQYQAAGVSSIDKSNPLVSSGQWSRSHLTNCEGINNFLSNLCSSELSISRVNLSIVFFCSWRVTI